MDTRFCCCGVSTWTKGIGWFQTLGSIISVFSLTFIICLMAQVTDDDLAKAYGNGILTYDEIRMIKSTFTAQCVFVALVLIFSIITFIMGNVLLRGTYTSNTRFLGAWIIFTLVSTILGILLTLAKWTLFDSSAFLPELLFLLFLVFLGGFGIYIVLTHRQDLQETC